MRTMKSMWKLTISVATVLALIGSFFVIESRWNQSDEVLAADTKIESIQKETAKTFKGIRGEIEKSNRKLDKKFTYQIQSMQLESLTKQYYLLKRKLKSSPNDVELREEFQDVKEQRAKLKEKMKEIVK